MDRHDDFNNGLKSFAQNLKNELKIYQKVVKNLSLLQAELVSGQNTYSGTPYADKGALNLLKLRIQFSC